MTETLLRTHFTGLIVIISLLLIIPALAQDAAIQTSPQYQTKQDILQTYGEPFWQGGYKDIDVWYYPHKRMFIFFEGDKVVRIDVVTGEKI